MYYDDYMKISHKIRKAVEEDCKAKFNDGYWWNNRDPQIQAFGESRVEHYTQEFGPGPHDIEGNDIKVGDKVAIALTIDRSSNLMIGRVTRIDHRGIQAENLVRTYGSVKLLNTYKFPERMIILK